MKVAIFGANGFLGRALTQYITEKGGEVIAIARSKNGCLDSADYQYWDGINHGEWGRALENTDAIVNLAGRTVNCRYNKQHKQEILESRVQTTQLIGEALHQLAHPPQVWINSSTATIYEHREQGGGARAHTEDDGVIGDDFSMGVAQAWEQAFFKVPSPIRKVAARTAIVLGAEQGSVFDRLSKITLLGLGGKMGTGYQMVSWIHEYDYCRAIEFCILNTTQAGVINVVSPQPESNYDFMRLLRQVWQIPIGLPTAKWMLKIGTFIMRTETELVLKSRWVNPQRLIDAGFIFKMPTLERALRELRGRSSL